MDYRAISSLSRFSRHGKMCFSGFIRCHASLKFIREAFDNSGAAKKRNRKNKKTSVECAFLAGHVREVYYNAEDSVYERWRDSRLYLSAREPVTLVWLRRKKWRKNQWGEKFEKLVFFCSSCSKTVFKLCFRREFYGRPRYLGENGFTVLIFGAH